MAFLSKILFKPNKVLEILSLVWIYYVFTCHVKRKRAVTSHVSDISEAVIHFVCVKSGQSDAHYSSLLNEDEWCRGAK